MLSWLLFFTFLSSVFAGGSTSQPSNLSCRNVPGDVGFPTVADFASLNTSVSGRLVKVVPFVEFCIEVGGCTAEQFTSSVFRDEVPGAMNQVNWEQNYDSTPPSICVPESPLTCGQGDVPLFAIAAESAADIQAGVHFARIHNLRIAIKASGHDYLGRSTARSSLLIWTHRLQSSNFTDNFVVDGQSLGPAVTLGSGVPLSQMYALTKAQGKFAVGGTASTVVPAGGYVQGGGHSAMSPRFGLAADNCLEIEVVLANGQLVKTNQAHYSDLFWAMRGGGAGTWGVVVSATFSTFPTFDAVVSQITITTDTTDQMAQVAVVHAKHIFDWDSLEAGQYFYVATKQVPFTNISITAPTMRVVTYFPNVTVEQATAALRLFINDVQKINGVNITEDESIRGNINDILFSKDDLVGTNLVLGSRLVPACTYRQNPELVGQVYAQLLNTGAENILGHLVAGGKVAENANVSNAINPAWRTAKTHMILANNWLDSATIPQVRGNETLFKRRQLPILELLSGENGAAYSNEADSLETNFRKVFFGRNYELLSSIKAKYDPRDLFIVKTGVGSERWDSDGICRNSRT